MLRRLTISTLLLLAAGCTGTKSKSTTVILRIEPGNAPPGIDHIDLTVIRDATVFVQQVKKGKTDSEVKLPTSLKVPLPADATGALLIEAKAFDGTGTQLATGSTEGEVMPEEVVTLTLEFGMDKRLQHDGGVASDPDAGAAMLSMTPPAANFGDAVTGQTSMATTFTVKNDGETATGALHIATTGSDPSLFTVDTATASCEGLSLAPAETCSVTLSFRPDAVGARSATLTVSGEPGGTIQGTLSGRGVAPGTLQLTPTMHDFGAVVTGQHDDLTLHVMNPGGAATGMLTTQLTSAPASELSISTDGCAGHTLAAAAGCDIVVRFAPTTVGAKSGSLTVSGTPGGAQMAMLMGRGIAPASLLATPTTQDFGTVVQGQTSTVTFTVSNPGGVTTGTLAAALSGSSAGEMTLTADGCTGHALSGGMTCTVTVSFTPTAAGPKGASFAVTGAPGQTVTVPLTGTVVTPGAITITPLANAFGSVLQGIDSAPVTLTVRNTGGAATGALTTTLGGSGMTQFTLVSNACTGTLAAGATCAIVVRFHPTTPGGKTASLAVAGNPGGTAAASLTGTGLAPALLAGDATTVDFGVVDVTTTSSGFVWTLRNQGDVPSGALSTTVTGDTTEFTLANTCTAAAAAGASCTVTVHLVPTSGGAKAVTIVVAGTPGGSAQLTAHGSGRALNLLTVSRTGTGSGSIAGTPAGIACPGTCSASYLYNTMVSLTATPSVGSSFSGWTGASCAGNPCIVTMSAAQTVSAAFTLIKYPVTVTATGMGSVTAPGGLSCGTTCAASYDYGTSVVLTATPVTGWSFGSWGGACSGTTPTCTVLVSQARSVTATFTINQFPLTVTSTGSGTVTSAPAGVACGATCAGSFDYGTSVVLTAAGAAFNHFVSWGGACSGSATTCTVSMTQARAVTASFAIDTHVLTVSVSGTGSVTSAPAGISCGNGNAACTLTVSHGTTVTLTETPGSHYHISGWGGCTAAAGLGTCAVQVNAAGTATASFLIDQNPLQTSVSGGGSITSTDGRVSCGSSCTTQYDYGTVVNLTAVTPAGHTFTGWGGGACSGTGACQVTMDKLTTVTAAWTTNNYTLSITQGAGNGWGIVTSNLGGVDCGLGIRRGLIIIGQPGPHSACSVPVPYGTTVVLTSAPSQESEMYGGAWTGCSANGLSCTLQILGDRAVTASYYGDGVDVQVLKSGGSAGRVTSTPAGMNCSGIFFGDICRWRYHWSSSVRLHATPTVGYFYGWTGCDSIATDNSGDCIVAAYGTRSVTAEFDPPIM